MASDIAAIGFALAATGLAAIWLRTRARFAGCRNELAELANSSLVTELEKHLLELIARGTPQQQLLDNVTGAIETMAPGCVCTVLLLDEEHSRFLLSGSAPSLPPAYMQAVSGLEIGPEVGACGSAAFWNQTIIVEDIATDNRFAAARDFVLSFGLQSCWSVPIRNFNHIVLGTFAMYHQKPARPLPAELRLVEAGARLAGNVIEKLRSEQRLRATSERLDLAEKAAEFGIWEVTASSGAVSVSEGFATLIGLPALSRKFSLPELESMLHPDDRAAVRTAAEMAIETGTFQAEFRIVLPDGDLDSFKAINDQYGHATGDQVLRFVSRRVLRSIRRTDVAARIGGDEFVILLPGASDRSEAKRVAEIIVQAVSEPMEYDGRELCVGSSVGLAIYPDDGLHTDELLKIADEDMYKVKLRRRTHPPRSVSQRTRVLDLKSASDILADLPPVPKPSLIGP